MQTSTVVVHGTKLVQVEGELEIVRSARYPDHTGPQIKFTREVSAVVESGMDDGVDQPVSE